MYRLLFVSIPLLLLFHAVAVYGQSEAPEDPEIVLPTALLSVESIPFDRVEAALPGSSQIMLPDLAVSLPPIHEMKVEPRLIIDEGFEEFTAIESSVFSTGSITTGTRNLIEGQLGVFKLGQDPRFRITFLHRGMDGYGGKRPGTGFFRSEQMLDGWIGSSAGNAGFETSLGFYEWQEGMQQISEYYYSSVLRFLDGGAEVSFRPDELIGVYGSLAAGTATRRYTVSETDAVPDPDSTVYFRPSAKVAVELPEFTLSLGLEYGFQDVASGSSNSVAPSHDGSVIASFEAHPSSIWDLFGNAGAIWLFGRRFEYPFALGSNYRPEDWLELQGEVGRRARHQLVSDHWRDLPLLLVPESSAPEPTIEWFLRIGGQADFLEQNLRLNADIEYIIDFSNRMLPLPYSESSVDEENGEDSVFPQAGFGYSVHQGSGLDFDLLLQYQVGRLARLRSGYTAAIPLFGTSANPAVAQHLAILGVTLGNDSGFYGGGVDVQIPVYSAAAMPLFDVHAYIQLTDGILLRAGMFDALSPLLQGERYQFDPATDNGVPIFSPFIEPGIRLQISAEITL